MADTRNPTALVSWAHRNPDWDQGQSDAWQTVVLTFANLLVEEGIAADLDLWHIHDTSIDWTRWGQRRVAETDYTIVVLSSAWRQRWEGSNKPTEGAGAVAEADTLKGQFFRDQETFQRKTVLVILPGASQDDVPVDLARLNRFTIRSLTQDGVLDLVSALTKNPRYRPSIPFKPRTANTVGLAAQPAADIENRQVVMAFDWEDSDRLLATQRAIRERYGAFRTLPLTRLAEAAGSTVCLVWSEAAALSPIVQAALEDHTRFPRVELWQTEPAPEPPVGIPHFAVSTNYGVPNRVLAELEKNLETATDDDLLFPSHVLGDRYCNDIAALERAASQYHIAIEELNAGQTSRMAAVLRYAAGLRFFGDWNGARAALQNEPIDRFQVGSDPLPHLLEAELISLEFESGFTSGIRTRTRSLIDESMRNGIWLGVIVGHRQMGMILQEGGAYSEAREHMSMAFHYSNELRESDILAAELPSRDGRIALTVDCLREFASLEGRATCPQSAMDMLADAGAMCADITADRPRAYLNQLINYESARLSLASSGTYEQNHEILRSTFNALQTFHNPTRLATILSAKVDLEMRFLRNSSARIHAMYEDLAKASRVYARRKHRYLLTRTTKTLGDLDYATGKVEEARDHFDQARREFNRLGKQPEAASCARSLSRCHFRLGEVQKAIDVLRAAQQRLTEADQENERSQIHAALARLEHPSLLNSSDADIGLLGVGEFAVHAWLRDGPLAGSEHLFPDITLGTGDDCAVLAVPPLHEMVITTDTLPDGLLQTLSHESADYAARLAVTASFSDVLAMGAVPRSILCNLHLTRHTPLEWVRRFMEQMQAEAYELGARLVGGDLKERRAPSLTTVATGVVPAGRALRRSGARVGDLIAITLSGRHDHAFDGLGTRWAHELESYLTSAERRIIEPLVVRNAKFEDLAIPVEIMNNLVERRLPTAAIDTSDGLLACTQLVGEASGVGVELSADALAPLINRHVRDLAESLGVAPWLFSMTAGHDWEVLLTISERDREKFKSLVQVTDGFPNVAIIGRVVPREPWSAENVRMVTEDGRQLGLVEYFTDEKFVALPARDRPRQWLDFAAEATNRLSAN